MTTSSDAKRLPAQPVLSDLTGVQKVGRYTGVGENSVSDQLPPLLRVTPERRLTRLRKLRCSCHRRPPVALNPNLSQDGRSAVMDIPAKNYTRKYKTKGRLTKPGDNAH